MRRTRRHRSVTWIVLLILLGGGGTLTWYLTERAQGTSAADGSVAAAVPDAAASNPAATQSRVQPDDSIGVVLAAQTSEPATIMPAATADASADITLSGGAAAATEPAKATAAPKSATSEPIAATSATQPTATPTSLPADGATAFGIARTKLAAGDLVGAREVLNGVLSAGMLSETETLEAKKQIGELNKTLVFSSRRLPGDPWVVSHLVEPGEVLAKLGWANGVTAGFLQQINGISDPRKMRSGYTIKIIKGPFHAVVTKHAYSLDLYLGAPGGPGSMYVSSFRVGLGTDDSTPTGKWIVEPGKKVRNPVYYDPRGQGMTIDAEDPTNPLGRYWIGLKGTDGASVGKLSYGIHGTIDPDSIGKQSSMGCIRLVNDDVAQVFQMLVDGKSQVVVLP